ncbi:hypothetical protein D3C75_1114630 [compost metagenome]
MRIKLVLANAAQLAVLQKSFDEIDLGDLIRHFDRRVFARQDLVAGLSFANQVIDGDQTGRFVLQTHVKSSPGVIGRRFGQSGGGQGLIDQNWSQYAPENG